MKRKWSARSERSMTGIHPDLRRVLNRALAESPLDFIVIEGLRSEERQRELVAAGASKTMNSRHLTGHAVDLLPIGPNGPAFDWPLYDELGPAVERAAADEGVAVEWGGRWQSFRDGPHFELDRDAYPASDWTTGTKAPTPRKSPAQSKTVAASAGQIVTAAGGVFGALSQLDGTVQIVVVAGCLALAGLAGFILRERLRAWAAGWR